MSLAGFSVDGLAPEEAARAFDAHGLALLARLAPAGWVDAARAHVLSRLDALPAEGPPGLLPLLSAILGPDFAVRRRGAVVALPAPRSSRGTSTGSTSSGSSAGRSPRTA